MGHDANGNGQRTPDGNTWRFRSAAPFRDDAAMVAAQEARHAAQRAEAWSAMGDRLDIVDAMESASVAHMLTASVWHAAIAEATARGEIRARLVSAIDGTNRGTQKGTL